MPNWLDGIENLDNERLENKNNESDDLSWLTAKNEVPTNFLEGIEKLEVSTKKYKEQVIKSFVQRNIIEIIKKQANKIQLTQPEMKTLKAFKDTFPEITIQELEEAANALK